MRDDEEVPFCIVSCDVDGGLSAGRPCYGENATGYNFDLDMLVTKKAYVTVNVTSGNNKSSGGCDMGLSGIALLALAGLATRRRL